jgi:hypothetical protein
MYGRMASRLFGLPNVPNEQRRASHARTERGVGSIRMLCRDSYVVV